MEKTVKKLLVATGLIASAAVALLPLTSYAAQTVTGPGYAHGYACNDSQSGNECARANQQEGGPTVVTVNVAPTLAFDASNAFSLTCNGSDDTCKNLEDGSKAIQAFPGMFRKGTLTARVRSAKPFTISLSAADPYLKNKDESGELISVIPARNFVDENDKALSGWGVQKTGETGYTGLSSQSAVFLTSDTPQDDFGDFNFSVGVVASDKTPQGLYSTEVTVTAATVGTN